jgi:hypothetical protein
MRADFVVALLSLTAPSALAQSRYRLAESMVGYDFFKAFTWETLDDPTHGRVNYIDQETAMERNLSYGTVLLGSSFLACAHRVWYRQPPTTSSSCLQIHATWFCRRRVAEIVSV